MGLPQNFEIFWIKEDNFTYFAGFYSVIRGLRESGQPFVAELVENTHCDSAGDMPRDRIKYTVADPGFPVEGGVDLVGGHGLPRRLHFENFVCQTERIWTP